MLQSAWCKFCFCIGALGCLLGVGAGSSAADSLLDPPSLRPVPSKHPAARTAVRTAVSAVRPAKTPTPVQAKQAAGSGSLNRWDNPSGEALWKVFQRRTARIDAFALGSWEQVRAGTIAPTDFVPVSPPALDAALGLATVYGPGSAGWFVAGGRRVHVRSTGGEQAGTTYSYESLARLGWAVGVATGAAPAAQILWDCGREEPMDLDSLLGKAAREADSAGAWIVTGLADFVPAHGRTLRVSPAGHPLDGPFGARSDAFDAVDAPSVRVLFTALAVEAAQDTPLVRALRGRFFPSDAVPDANGLLIRTHFGTFSSRVSIDPSRPVQAIWGPPEKRDYKSAPLPRISDVLEARPGTRVGCALLALYAVGRLVPYDLYEKPDLADLHEMDPTLLIEQRWATDKTFLSEPIYPRPRILLRRPVAEAIVRINARLVAEGLRLKIYDGYRPLSVTQRLYHLRPDSRYLAVPNIGSRHNRGAAVDVTLSTAAGHDLPMPSDYLTFDVRSHRNAPGMTAEALANMEKLTAVMGTEGFTTINEEWWHYDAPNWLSYPVMDEPLWPGEGVADLPAPSDPSTRPAVPKKADVFASESDPTDTQGF